MRTTKKEDYALILMKSLVQFSSHDYVSLSFVAQKEKLSPLFLKHIAKKLLEKGLIESKEGVRGGYRLKKSPKKITLSEIIDSVSGRIISPSCTYRNSCPRKRSACNCFNLWEKVNQKLFWYLHRVTLADFVKF